MACHADSGVSPEDKSRAIRPEIEKQYLYTVPRPLSDLSSRRQFRPSVHLCTVEMSGAEAAGLILAVLPLIMHTVDSYVQGVQTLKRFRTRRYREELEDYKLRIETQQTEFLNTLELLFDGIVDREDEIRDLITNPKGQLWTDSTIDTKLRKRLAHSYEVYIQTMWKLYSLLQQIHETLGTGTESVKKVFAISSHEVSSTRGRLSERKKREDAH
jgi:hypothetical protein